MEYNENGIPYDSDVYSYYIDDQPVSEAKYYETLHSYFDETKATRLTNDISVRELKRILSE